MNYSYSASKKFSNFLTFQLGWFACAYWHDGKALLVTLILIFWLYQTEPWSRHRLIATFQVALIGITADLTLCLYGVIKFNSYFPVPPWLITLWCLFASTLTVSLNWAMTLRWVSFCLGFVIGPIAYWGGSTFSALKISSPYNYWIIAAVWGALMALFSMIINYRAKMETLPKQTAG